MMTLTQHFSSQVPSKIRERGHSYYLSRAVHIEYGDKRLVQATVQGGDTYEVTLELRRKKLRAWCSCPFCEDNFQVCKHIWATLLAADAKHYLTRAAAPNVRIEMDEGLAEEREPSEEEWGEGEEEWDEFEEPERRPEWALPLPRNRSNKGKKPAPANWKKQLASLNETASPFGFQRAEVWPSSREIIYIIDVPSSQAGHGLGLEVTVRERERDGGWGKPRAQRIGLSQIASLPDPDDRHILATLAGAREQTGYYGYSSYHDYDSAPARYSLAEPMQEILVPLLCRTGRCRLRVAQGENDLKTLAWEEGEPWELWLEVRPVPSGKEEILTGSLRRGEEKLPLSAPLLLTTGLVFFPDRAARLRHFGAFRWAHLLRNRDAISVPAGQKDELLKELLKQPHLPRLDLPEDMHFEEVQVPPRPRLKVKPPERTGWPGYERLQGELTFDYDGEVVRSTESGRGVFQVDRRRFLVRDPAAEAEAADRLRQLGFRNQNYYNQGQRLELAPRNLPRVVRTLLEAGWHVEAEGKIYRRPGEIHIEVNSGIDWFELHGGVQFDDKVASLPALLAVLRRGENLVKLDDGTFGMLPEDWLKKYGVLAGLGTAQDDHLRFRRSQVGLLDALLASQPEAQFDEVFARARDELRNFEGITAVDPPAGFTGQLRGYQRAGLGWLYFLQRFGFGGCRADDMGLGKTVQVLALMESRRELRARPDAAGNGQQGKLPPSLVVVPRSLVFNWRQEAARFTPGLKVLDHTGINRAAPGEHFHDHDVVLTTYGTLRRDILQLKDFAFDYCIVDEAQAVKNASTESAKAVRLVQAGHRLALSGTPVENHLGELWSLFEFLNPGMLGGASVFKLGGAGARNPDEETRRLLARGLRPFILRRTKEQVAKDLPQKTEQTLFCEMEPPQRKLYDELRDHYRRSLLDRVAREGIGKAKIQILEALLRLRQAACHPGLIDKKRTADASAKLDMLLPQLTEVAQEGQKVLVFSQFTSLLAIVRERLEKEKIPYEYLDGRTRNRQAKVERFQSDPECKLFLISLKAGGLGLNLTAAEYVFLLDPWWNPAVEAQAIDRTHRIGQTRPVFAYRLIAKDTVEEKVLELQKSKRALADAIINADNSLIRTLSQEDLQLLLS
jgi:superfamily II DNA or RNA helicase